jgi:S1-C subfamily serine protease
MADSTLKSLSEALAGVVEASSPSIVRVEARRRLPATGIVWADNVIVTAHHVVEAEENITIGLHDGDTTTASLVGRDPNTDIAVLRANKSLSAANIAPDDNVLKVGHLVLALGRPTQNLQATFGVVSAINDSVSPGGGAEFDVLIRREGRHGEGREVRRRFSRRWESGRWWMAIGGRMEGAIQTDVVMYPGFSGGPLVDAAGLVRGMNTSAVQGVSMTVPASSIQRVVDMLLKHGKMRRGFLGIGAQPVRLPDALAKQLDQETGLMLVSVEDGSPAEKGKLFIGDIIVGLDGHAVTHLEELLALLSGDRVGKEVPVQILRGGQLQEVKVTIGERD